MFTLKPLSIEAVPGALAKAERYRLLSEPWQAESICRDVLAIDRSNQAAVATLILSITEQFDAGVSMQSAIEMVEELSDPYERAYFSGIVHERRALAVFRQTDFRSGDAVYALLEHAMQWYEKAQALAPPTNNDAVLRWNTCVRFLQRYPQLSRAAERLEPVLSE
jgi:hypothetical protein